MQARAVRIRATNERSVMLFITFSTSSKVTETEIWPLMPLEGPLLRSRPRTEIPVVWGENGAPAAS